MSEEFNEKSFNWKKKIWDIGQRLAVLEERVNNELRHQGRFTRWVLVILAGIIIFLTTAFLTGIFTK